MGFIIICGAQTFGGPGFLQTLMVVDTHWHMRIYTTHMSKNKVCCIESRQKPTGSGISSIPTSNKNAEHNLIHIYTVTERCAVAFLSGWI